LSLAFELVSLSSEYKRQLAWRDWATIFDSLPSLHGRTVLDLGCGVGDLAAMFVARGAHVIGFDMNEELLREARSQRIPNAEFRMANLRSFPDLGISADGLWCSFTAAYFPELPTVLAAWARNLKTGGWIALTEIDDLFGHEPLSVQTKALLSAYAEDSLAAGRYDFQMGRKMRDHLERAGFVVSKMQSFADQELAFSGPAPADVLDAWRPRFSRMKLLRDFCGPDFDHIQEEFLNCLVRTDHRSVAKVYCCIATKKGADA
jgi:ubiquinone/menaquinone biosynthesis C-methylase UbiE